MFYLFDHPKTNYTVLYLNTESINNKNEFFRRVLNQVLKTDFVKQSIKIKTFLEKHKPNIKKVGMDGIEFGVSEDHDYFEMLSKILKSTQSLDKKLVIMIDEFPETLANIIKDEKDIAGKQFLQSNRELRQDPEISKKILFIYAGSIGLENLVSKLNAVNTINDLSRLPVPPLNTSQAKFLINKLCENLEFRLSDELVEIILQEIEWLIPFFLQLILDEINFIYRNENLKKVTKETIRMAFENMLEQRQHFEHWHTRLRGSFKSDEYNFAKEVLNVLSESAKIKSTAINNLAVKHKVENISNDIVYSLIYDGYINNNDDVHIYCFNSPILRMWWRKNVAN